MREPSMTERSATPAVWNPRPIFGSWTPDQERVARCFPRKRRVVVPAANGVGKTYLAADLVASFIADMPEALVILTAPTNRQVSELLWPHVADRLLFMNLAAEEWTIPTRPKWGGGDGDSVIGFATNRPQRLQGFHAGNLLVVVDEASGLPQRLADAFERVAVGEANYILAIGNPNTADGAFYRMTHLPSWHTETISALTHPNVVQRKEVIPGATTWTSMVDRIRDWCREAEEPTGDTFTVEISDRDLQAGPDEVRRPRHFVPQEEFKIGYLGIFPSAVEWSLLARDQVRRAQLRQLPEDGPKTAAVDVARTGGDRTVYALRAGDTVTRMEIVPAADLVTQARCIARLLDRDEPISITCDAAGIGFGLVDSLREMTRVNVIPFHGSEVPVSPLEAQRFLNRRAAAYAHLQQAFEHDRVAIPDLSELAEELLAVRYRHTDDGRMIMLNKDDIKRLLGRSPDLADVVSMLWETSAFFSASALTSDSVIRPLLERW